MALTKFGGVTMRLGEKEWEVPPLSLRQIQGLQGRLLGYTGEMDEKSVELVIDTVHAALSRNYPELARDEVADMVDVGNMGQAMRAVMGVSGLVEKSSGEAPATESSTG